MSRIAILILDDDEASQNALRHVLDSEGWRVHIVPLADRAMSELASGTWTLAIANVAMTGLDGPLFNTLKELALAPPLEAGRRRVRVLFLVPELMGVEVQAGLERERLPYSLKPFHLHDFLEKVSDLLLEAEAIPGPIRRVRYEHKPGERRSVRERRTGRERRQTPMFAAREDTMMTEEEIAEYERQEEEERKKKEKKELPETPY